MPVPVGLLLLLVLFLVVLLFYKAEFMALTAKQLARLNAKSS